MGSTCTAHGETRNSYKILFGKPQMKIEAGKPKCICEDNSKIDF